MEQNALNRLTLGRRRGIIKARGLSFEEYINNPLLLAESTPAEKYNYYLLAGYTVKPLGNGSFKGIPFEEGGGYRVFFDDSMQKMLMYHPEKRSHHKGAYYKLSEGKYGTRRFKLDGTALE